VQGRYVIGIAAIALAALVFFLFGGAYAVGCLLFGGHDC
jgi:hypothetical protein